MLEFYHKNVGTDEFYGVKENTYTMHAQLHLKEQVYEKGPLECHALNSFEVNK